jgi:phosphohistidine phosphatase
MLKNGIIPESVFSSPAERTKLTAKICLKQIVFKGKFYVEDALYDTHADTYADVLAGINNAENSIMVVGHNPEISDTVTMLTGENIFMTPCSMACIEFSTVDWISVFSEKGILKWVETPR